MRVSGNKPELRASVRIAEDEAACLRRTGFHDCPNKACFCLREMSRWLSCLSG